MKTSGTAISGGYKFADEFASYAKIKKLGYLCFTGEGKHLSNADIERNCAGCECQCGYGKQWLKLYWQEQDEAWEAERQAK